jgi:hypothetical protein
MQDLVQGLNNCVDGARKIIDNMGLRPYEVFLIKTRWGDPNRGETEEVIASETKITPTPRVIGISAIGNQLYSVGMVEIGTVTVDQISLNYSEDILRGTGTAENENFFWEIRGKFPNAERRRFTVSSMPERRYTPEWGWTIGLEKADSNRETEGRVYR